MFESCKRYRLSVLDYIVTSNHIHLLVQEKRRGCIAKGMQLTAGRVAQEYNRRKSRKGAFWQDRYFATAVATDQHLVRCIVYIDLNMVRAGVVRHPSQWNVCGFNEIHSSRLRYRIIDVNALCKLTGAQCLKDFRHRHRSWIETELEQGVMMRQPEWSKDAAVGPDSFKAEFHS